ncbi:unnamed protein product [Aphanomyces euteiches]
MRSPDEALLRSRSKAPLDQVDVLYLTNCALDVVANLDACTQLHSLYLQHNRLVDLTGLPSLRHLWHVDLSYNKKLHDLSPLTAFPALGYLSLEHCDCTFDDLATLRDIHIVQLQLGGNAPLQVDGQQVYRLKVAALLPNLWTLDGLYITGDHRLLALDQYGELGLMETPDRFGAVSTTWHSSSATNPHGQHLATIVSHQPTHRLARETYRLKALLHFYDIAVHQVNAGISFAPPKTMATAWPVVPTKSLVHLAPRARLNLAILVAARLDFPSIPSFLLLDALTINLLGHVDATDIRAIIEAPSFVSTALLFLLGQQSHEGSLGLPENDRKLWASLPVVLSNFIPPPAPDDEFLFSRRCCYAVILLSRAPSFPAIAKPTDASTVVSAVYKELLPLLEKAKMRVEDLFPDADTGAWISSQRKMGGLLGGTPSQLPWNKHSQDNRTYDRPWASDSPSKAAGSAESMTTTPLSPQPATLDDGQPLVKVGDWVQVRARQYVPIIRVSGDRKFVVLARFQGQQDPPFCGNSTVAIDKLSKVPPNMWKMPLEGSLSKAKSMGKLHRQPQGFHKLGIPRAIGVPNLDLTADDVAEACDAQPALAESKSVQLFTTQSSWNANYVLAPPQMIHAQNYWMEKSNPEEQGWSHIGAPIAEFNQPQLVQPRPLGPKGNVANVLMANYLKERAPSQVADTTPESHSHNNLSEMQQLQRDMAMLLGKTVEDEQSSNVSCFVTETTVQEPRKQQQQSSQQESPHPRPFDIPASTLVALHEASKPKVCFKSWHAVQAKPRFIVASMPSLNCNKEMHFIFEFAMSQEEIPRVRWNESDHRFHYTVPTGEQPGDEGFYMIHEVGPNESGATLPPVDQTKLLEMQAANNMIHDLEVAKKYRDTIKFLEHKRSNHKSNKELYDERSTSQGDVVANEAVLHEKKPRNKHISMGKSQPHLPQHRQLKQPKNTP